MQNFIANQFKKPTGIFGRIISFMMKRQNGAAYDKVIPQLDIQPKDRILEIGYGHGLGVERLASDYDCFVGGIDFSALMFAQASKRNKRFIDEKRVQLEFGDFLSLPMSGDPYDKVFCINVIYFWDKLEAPFAKVYENLKDGGVFCIYMARREDLMKMSFTEDEVFNKYSIEKVVEALKGARFMEITYSLDRGYVIKGRK